MADKCDDLHLHLLIGCSLGASRCFLSQSFASSCTLRPSLRSLRSLSSLAASFLFFASRSRFTLLFTRPFILVHPIQPPSQPPSQAPISSLIPACQRNLLASMFHSRSVNLPKLGSLFTILLLLQLFLFQIYIFSSFPSFSVASFLSLCVLSVLFSIVQLAQASLSSCLFFCILRPHESAPKP